MPLPGSEKTLATLRLPAGSYVVIAKCTVQIQLVVEKFPDNLTNSETVAEIMRHSLMTRSIHFGLTFAGVTDRCQVRAIPDTFNTVCVTVAGTHSLGTAAAGGGLSSLASFRGRSEYNEPYIRAWVRDVALTAIPVAEIAPPKTAPQMKTSTRSRREPTSSPRPGRRRRANHSAP